MSVVAERLLLAPFAEAEDVGLVLGCELDGLELGALVGAVAEGLLLGESAGAVEVLLADFELESELLQNVHVGDQLVDVGLLHVGLLLLGLGKDLLDLPQLGGLLCVTHSNNFFQKYYIKTILRELIPYSNHISSKNRTRAIPTPAFHG